MIDFKKEFYCKIMALVVAIVLFLNSTAYGIAPRHITHLRKPLDFEKLINLDINPKYLCIMLAIKLNREIIGRLKREEVEKISLDSEDAFLNIIPEIKDKKDFIKKLTEKDISLEFMNDELWICYRAFKEESLFIKVKSNGEFAPENREDDINLVRSLINLEKGDSYVFPGAQYMNNLEYCKSLGVSHSDIEKVSTLWVRDFEILRHTAEGNSRAKFAALEFIVDIFLSDDPNVLAETKELAYQIQHGQYIALKDATGEENRFAINALIKLAKKGDVDAFRALKSYPPYKYRSKIGEKIAFALFKIEMRNRDVVESEQILYIRDMKNFIGLILIRAFEGNQTAIDVLVDIVDGVYYYLDADTRRYALNGIVRLCKETKSVKLLKWIITNFAHKLNSGTVDIRDDAYQEILNSIFSDTSLSLELRIYVLCFMSMENIPKEASELGELLLHNNRHVNTRVLFPVPHNVWSMSNVWLNERLKAHCMATFLILYNRFRINSFLTDGQVNGVISQVSNFIILRENTSGEPTGALADSFLTFYIGRIIPYCENTGLFFMIEAHELWHIINEHIASDMFKVGTLQEKEFREFNSFLAEISLCEIMGWKEEMQEKRKAYFENEYDTIFCSIEKESEIAHIEHRLVSTAIESIVKYNEIAEKTGPTVSFTELLSSSLQYIDHIDTEQPFNSLIMHLEKLYNIPFQKEYRTYSPLREIITIYSLNRCGV